MPFLFTSLEIPDIILIEPRAFPDSRGFFLESYKESDFRSAGIDATFVQDNHSRSARGVLRGLHFQLPPDAQAKLVRVAHGAVWDVAVDVRRGSGSFGHWVAAELSDQNQRMLYIPQGFAHGFLTLSESADFVYKCTAEYSASSDGGIRWDDPEIGIGWPVKEVHVSGKDKALPGLSEARVFDQEESG